MSGLAVRPRAQGDRRRAERARNDAEATAMVRLVCIYLRESGLGAPATTRGPGGRRWVRVPLPHASAAVVAPLLSLSVIGQHRIGTPMLLATLSEPPHVIRTAAELAELLAAELLAAGRPGTGLVAVARTAGAGTAGTRAGTARDGTVCDRTANTGTAGDGTAGDGIAGDGTAGDGIAGMATADALAVVGIGRAVERSVRRSARYRARRLALPDLGLRGDLLDAHDPGVAAEQSLVSGHPFHPTPKSAEGFDPDDADRYAPEMGAAFPLWWFAASPGATCDEHVPGLAAPPVPVDVAVAARALLGPGRAGWGLLPCHPWQARLVSARDDVADALDRGQVRLLGPLGGDVHPTSSVRTVRLPGGDYWKLALDVRITNFVRHNPPEEVRRTLDASRVVASLARVTRTSRFEVLPESGARALALSGDGTAGGDTGGDPACDPWSWPPPVAPTFPANAPDGTGNGAEAPDGYGLVTATAALHRPAPGPGPTPLVVAGLLEPDPLTGAAPLARLVRRAARSAEVGTAAIAPAWVRAYLAVTLRPLLRLVVDEGVSLEAHPQNALVGFSSGWPRRLVVRDLEGTSIDRSHPRAARHRRVIGRADSPVLYSPEEAWGRFAYHVVVNHVGLVVATVAAECRVAEESLWEEVGAVVVAEVARATGRAADHARASLLGPGLPAKANLLSLLHGRSGNPAYVAVPNPLRASAP